MRIMKNKARVHLLISGYVQGVFFRAKTAQQAGELGLTGWVRNTKDGKVESVVEGEREKIEKMITWIKKGPAQAQVKEVEIQWQPYQGEFSSFEIRHD